MGEMNKVNGLLILVGIGVKRRGIGVGGEKMARSDKKNSRPIKMKKGIVK